MVKQGPFHSIITIPPPLLRRCFWSDRFPTPVKEVFFGQKSFPTSIEEVVSVRSPEKKINFLFLFCIPWKMWHCYLSHSGKKVLGTFHKNKGENTKKCYIFTRNKGSVTSLIRNYCVHWTYYEWCNTALIPSENTIFLGIFTFKKLAYWTVSPFWKTSRIA